MNNQYQVVTDRIVAMLEAGTRPWSRPWVDGAPVPGGMLARPLRVTGEAYTGINVVNLWCAAQARGFGARHWMTFKAAKDMGASVKKGAKAELAFYVGRHTVTDEKNGEETERTINFLRAYHVFNADEIDGLPPRFLPVAPVVAPDAPVVPAPALPPHILAAQAFIGRTGASIAYGGDRAFYMPSMDAIRMPLMAQFREPSLYIATLLHELAHWTSHETRCNRELGKRFGDEAYACEELIAELASAFLCADLAIDSEPRADHADYIASWIRVLKNDNRAIFKAATLAEAASRFLHATQAPAEPAPAPEPAPAEPAEPAEPEANPFTITEILREAGYGHRRNDTSVASGRHTVFRLDTGETVGNFAAHEALAYVRGETTPAAAEASPRAPAPIAILPAVPAPAPAPAVTPAGKPRRKPGAMARPIGAKFKAWDDFQPALHAARMAAREALGYRWDLHPSTVWARLPSAWCRVPVFGRVARCPRDMLLPHARYWPSGELPAGIEYATRGPAEPPLAEPDLAEAA